MQSKRASGRPTTAESKRAPTGRQRAVYCVSQERPGVFALVPRIGHEIRQHAFARRRTSFPSAALFARRTPHFASAIASFGDG